MTCPILAPGLFNLETAALGTPVGARPVRRDLAYVIDVLRDTIENLKNRKTLEKKSPTGHAVLGARHCRDSTHYPPPIDYLRPRVFS